MARKGNFMIKMDRLFAFSGSRTETRSEGSEQVLFLTLRVTGRAGIGCRAALEGESRNEGRRRRGDGSAS